MIRRLEEAKQRREAFKDRRMAYKRILRKEFKEHGQDIQQNGIDFQAKAAIDTAFKQWLEHKTSSQQDGN